MKKFENVRLDYEDTITGIKFEEGKYLHVKEESGIGGIFLIHRRTSMDNEFLFKCTAIYKTRGQDVSNFAHYAPTCEMEPYLTADHVTFTVVNHTDNILEIDDLEAMVTTSDQYDRFQGVSGRTYNIRMVSPEPMWVNVTTSVNRDGETSTTITDDELRDRLDAFREARDNSHLNTADESHTDDIASYHGMDVGEELRQHLANISAMRDESRREAEEYAREAEEAERATAENDSITFVDSGTHAVDRILSISSPAIDAVQSIGRGERNEHPIGDHHTMRGERDEDGNLIARVTASQSPPSGELVSVSVPKSRTGTPRMGSYEWARTAVERIHRPEAEDE